MLVDHVLEDVGHVQWVFTIPKMLRRGVRDGRDRHVYLLRRTSEEVRTRLHVVTNGFGER